MKELSREQVREIVLEEQKLLSNETFKRLISDSVEVGEDGALPTSKFAILEFLTREEIYDYSPKEVNDLIRFSFKEIVGVNAMIGMMVMGTLGELSEEKIDIDSLDEESKFGLQIIKEFGEFFAKYPIALSIDDEDDGAREAFQNLRKALSEQDMSNASEDFAALMMKMGGGIHSCVKVYISSVDEDNGEIVFDFAEESDQDEFCKVLKIPKKPESMVLLKGCDFEDYPIPFQYYDLNIVELEDVHFDEVTDSASIGISMEGDQLGCISPFYEIEDDED